jgi:hypothetical protein
MNDFNSHETASMEAATEAATVAATACLERFHDAFNAGDLAGCDAELHFPHTLLSGPHRLLWDAPGQLPAHFFDSLRATGWVHTQSEARTPVLVSADKVHFVVAYTRRGAANEVLGAYRNLWIVTRCAGRWGISLRSY